MYENMTLTDKRKELKEMIETLYPMFRKWSWSGAVWLISDTHLGDGDRPYMGYDIDEEEQIKRIKAKAHRCDTLIHLGDVGEPEYFKEIKSHKVLIMGNHDETPLKFEKYFDEIYRGPLFIAEKILLSHEPVDLRGLETGMPIAINIHGHNHAGPVQQDAWHYNIAQNVFGYEPLNLNEWIKEGHMKMIKSVHRDTIDKATAKKKRKARLERRK